MSRGTVTYCVTCGERVAGDAIVTDDGGERCVKCWQEAHPGEALPDAPKSKTKTRKRTGVTEQPLIPDKPPTGRRSGTRTNRRMDSRVGRSGANPRQQAQNRTLINVFLFAGCIGLLIGGSAVWMLRGGGDDGQGSAPVVADGSGSGSAVAPAPGSGSGSGSGSAPGSGSADSDDDLAGSGSGIAPDDDAWKRAVCEHGALLGNTKSKKLHLHDCRWGNKTSKHNRKNFDDVDVPLRQGYQWCGECSRRVEDLKRKHR